VQTELVKAENLDYAIDPGLEMFRKVEILPVCSLAYQTWKTYHCGRQRPQYYAVHQLGISHHGPSYMRVL